MRVKVFRVRHLIIEPLVTLFTPESVLTCVNRQVIVEHLFAYKRLSAVRTIIFQALVRPHVLLQMRTASKAPFTNFTIEPKLARVAVHMQCQA